MAEPKSTKPYLIRAVYQWCTDNGYTPHISVVVDSRTRVPMEHVRNGEIILNIGPEAASRLKIGDETIECTVRFARVARDLLIPVAAVTAIYARENGEGMSFKRNENTTGSDPSSGPAAVHPKEPPKRGGKPDLRRIK
ncbi:MAG TPA: ClpXP protease specificity-enhancing factor [Burkholderiales bacterium]|nr:ClpXP protease specificity-enhancing factor [Burkholderiales bacterium]